jgi:hypothetical protein
MTANPARAPLRPGAILAGRSARRFAKLDPRQTDPQSGDLRHRGRGGAARHLCGLRDLVAGRAAGFAGQIAAWLWFTVLFANFAEAVAEGRGKAQADSLRATRSDDLAPSAARSRRRRTSARPRSSRARLLGRRRRAGRGRRPHPRRRRGRRGRRLGQRVRHHRRVRARHPRGGRRPLGRDRRHAVVSDWIKVRITAEARRHLPRPHDRAGRGREAPEDAERDRARRSCSPADADLPDRGRDAARGSPPIPARRLHHRAARCSSR